MPHTNHMTSYQNMNTDISSYTIIKFIINKDTCTRAIIFKWRTRDLRASQRASVQYDAKKPAKLYDCGGVRRRSVSETELPYMFIATHIQGIRFAFHAIHITFSMQFITFSGYYFILVYIVLFFCSRTLGHL